MSPARDVPALVASVIDVGSNSVLLLTVELDAGGRARQRDAALVTTRLGSGLEVGGPLDRAARTRTRDAVVALAGRARSHGASRLWGFATGAARRARDGRDFASELTQAAGCPVAVLSGDEEAALAYAAIRHACAEQARTLLAVDVGGATTELTLGRGEAIRGVASLPLGALALTERDGDVAAEVARVLADERLLASARAAGAVVAASGGTATGAFPGGLRVSARGAEVRFGFSVRGWDSAFARSSVTTISPRSIVESLVCPSASAQVCPGCLQLQAALNSRR